MRDRLLAAGLFLLVLVPHLTYLHYSNGDFFYPDSFTYLAPAQSLLHGWGFSTGVGVAETLRTPGYPLFLLPFLRAGAGAWVICAAQHLMVALLGAAIFLWLRNVGRALSSSAEGRLRRLDELRARPPSRIAAALPAFVLAFDTSTIHYANKVLSETLFTCVLVLIVVLALERRVLLITGLLCGALVLIRPVAILWFVIVALYLALKKTPWRAIAGFVAMALLLPALWAVRNGIETGVYTVASIGGTNLLLHRAAPALAMEDGDGNFSERLAARQEQLLRVAYDEIRAAEGVEDPDELPHAVRARYFSRLARRIIRFHPVGLLQTTMRGLAINVAQSDWEAIEDVSDVDESVLEHLIRIWTLLLWSACTGGLVMLFRRDRAAALFLALTILYYIGISAGSEAEARFRTPVVPLLAIAAASMIRTPSGG